MFISSYSQSLFIKETVAATTKISQCLNYSFINLPIQSQTKLVTEFRREILIIEHKHNELTKSNPFDTNYQHIRMSFEQNDSEQFYNP